MDTVKQNILGVLEMGMNGKGFLAVVMAAAFALAAFVVAPVLASAAEDYPWETYGDPNASKLSASPKDGTFIIETTDYVNAGFEHRLDFDKAGAYNISVEVKIENFKRDAAIDQRAGLFLSRSVNGSMQGFGGTDANMSNGAWQTVSCKLNTELNDSFYLRLFLEDCKAKVTFRNLRIETVPLASKSYEPLNERIPQIKSDTDISKRGFEDSPGGVTIDYATAKRLTAEKPEVIRDTIKTVADLEIFMLVAEIAVDGFGSLKVLQNGNEWWEYNLPAAETLKMKIANCGDCANLARYMLDGDYEEIGFLQGNELDGGHVWNYVKHNGTYYSIDFVQRLWTDKSGVVQAQAKSLSELMPTFKQWGHLAVAAYTTPGLQLPVLAEFTKPGGIIIYFPKNAKYTVFYETSGDKGVVMRGKEVPILPELDWTVPQDKLPVAKAKTAVSIGTPTFAAGANVTNLDTPTATPTPAPTPDPNAPKVGTKIGDVLFTDIKAYINGSQIPACNIGGSMYIFAADLRNYGFDVQYDNATRSTTIKLDKGKAFAPLDVAKTTGSVGAKIGNVLYTDIKTYINGKEVTSVNVDGKTAVPFAELKAFGEVKYDNATRSSTLTIK